MMTPNSPIPATKIPIEQMLMTGFLNSVNGSKGSTAFVSAYRKPASMTADHASKPSTRVEAHPYSVTQVRASRSGAMQADHRGHPPPPPHPPRAHPAPR